MQRLMNSKKVSMQRQETRVSARVPCSCATKIASKYMSWRINSLRLPLLMLGFCHRCQTQSETRIHMRGMAKSAFNGTRRRAEHAELLAVVLRNNVMKRELQRMSVVLTNILMKT